MKTIYVSAWILLAAAVLVAAVTGVINAAAMVTFNLVALGLFYALALRSVVVNTRDLKSK